MARCFDHGTTVLVQYTAEEATVRQEAEPLLQRHEYLYVGGSKGAVKFWYRKEDATWFKEELPSYSDPTGPRRVGYCFLLFRGRDLAYQRGWLKVNHWPDYSVPQIRALAEEDERKWQEHEERRNGEERNRVAAVKEQQRISDEEKMLEEAGVPLFERRARARGMGNLHPERPELLKIFHGLWVQYGCGCIEQYEGDPWFCAKHSRR